MRDKSYLVLEKKIKFTLKILKWPNLHVRKTIDEIFCLNIMDVNNLIKYKL